MTAGRPSCSSTLTRSSTPRCGRHRFRGSPAATRCWRSTREAMGAAIDRCILPRTTTMSSSPTRSTCWTSTGSSAPSSSACARAAGVCLVMAATHPERVHGVVAINPGLNLTPPHRAPCPGSAGFDDEPQSDEGWALENRHHWLRDWRRFTEFFFGEMLPEPHSTKQHEDCVEWSLEIGPETMLAGWGARRRHSRADPDRRRRRLPAGALPGARDQRRPGHVPAARAQPSRCRAHRRRVARARRAPAISRTPATR